MEAARLAARSWTPGGPDPDGGAEAPPRSARRSPGGKQPSSGGSGFIVNRAGVVLTNHNVIDGCCELRVMRNEKPVEATLIAADPADDLAILRLPESVADQRRCAETSRSSRVRRWSSSASRFKDC
jgi:S1-C subfamily serine protease